MLLDLSGIRFGDGNGAMNVLSRKNQPCKKTKASRDTDQFTEWHWNRKVSVPLKNKFAFYESLSEDASSSVLLPEPLISEASSDLSISSITLPSSVT